MKNDHSIFIGETSLEVINSFKRFLGLVDKQSTQVLTKIRSREIQFPHAESSPNRKHLIKIYAGSQGRAGPPESYREIE